MSYNSETSTCRERLAKFCVGNGLDIGAGGDAFIPNAICIDRAPGDPSRANTGTSPTHLVGDAWKLHWFSDGVLDFVASSHTLEDAQDTESVLREWIRVLKPGGHLVLFLPDEQVYRAHCKRTGQPYNFAHQHSEFSLRYVQEILDRIGQTKTVHALWPVPNNAYSFDLVVQKL